VLEYMREREREREENASERTGRCENEVHGQMQMETSAVATPLRELQGTGVSDRQNRYFKIMIA